MNNFTFEKVIWNALAMDDYYFLVNQAKCLNGTDNVAIQNYINKFVSFYKVRRHKETWIKPFFRIFKQALNDDSLNFEKYLTFVEDECIQNKKHQIERSFTSKMLHTIRPDKFPILDDNVLSALDIPNNADAYAVLNNKINTITKNPAFKRTMAQLRRVLAKNLGQNKLSEYKIADLILFLH